MAGYIGSRAAVATSGVERKKSFAITTTTTSLTGLDYTPNHVHVFHNGIRLVDGTDYTATNGTSITLVNAAENGDEVVVVSLGTFSPADTYTKTEADDRYVNASGDTMTGDLLVGTTTSASTSLHVYKSTGEIARFSAPNGQTGSIIIGRPDVSTEGAKLQYNSSNGDATFGTVYTGHAIVLSSGATERMRIDSAGRVTMPYQPHFYVKANYGSHTVLNYASPDWSVVYENNGGHFNTSTNLFTAPVDGRYFFSTHALIDKSQNSGNNYAYTTFLRNGTSYADLAHTPSNGTTSYIDISLSSVVYLLAGDTIEARYDTLSGARFYAGQSFNSFTGYLIG